MAKIIYKKGMEGQNNLSSIEGIEIDLLNGQKALIYPKYAEKHLLTSEQISKWVAKKETEIEALKVEDTKGRTEALWKIGSPAAEWVSQFCSDGHGRFNVSSLLASLEIQHHKKEMDALAETIKGADLLRDFTSYTLSCSLYNKKGCWCALGHYDCVSACDLDYPILVIPTILYR